MSQDYHGVPKREHLKKALRKFTKFKQETPSGRKRLFTHHCVTHQCKQE